MESLYRQFYEEGVKLAQLEFSRKYAAKATRVHPGVTPATPMTEERRKKERELEKRRVYKNKKTYPKVTPATPKR